MMASTLQAALQAALPSTGDGGQQDSLALLGDGGSEIFSEVGEEASIQLSIGGDKLSHLLPPPTVPPLDLHRFEPDPQSPRIKLSCSEHSVRPPPPPQTFTHQQDEIFWPINRPGNYLSVSSSRRSGSASARTRASAAVPIPHRAQTARGTTRNRVSAPGQRPSTTQGRHVHQHPTGVPSSSGTHAFNAEYRGTSNATVRRAAAQRPQSSSSRVRARSAPHHPGRRIIAKPQSRPCSPRLEQMSQPRVWSARGKHISASHSIRHVRGRPPRMAYSRPSRPAYTTAAKLPRREDHPAIVGAKRVVAMHRPQMLAAMQKKRAKALAVAAARGEPHAIRERDEKLRAARLKTAHTVRKGIMKNVRMLIRREQDAKAQAPASAAPSPPPSSRPPQTTSENQTLPAPTKRRGYLSPYHIELAREKELASRAYVYREWDRYERSTSDAPEGSGTASEISAFDKYVAAHSFMWQPQTTREVLNEERYAKSLIRSADRDVRKLFKGYEPAICNHSNKMRIRMKRAGHLYIDKIRMERLGSSAAAPATGATTPATGESLAPPASSEAAPSASKDLDQGDSAVSGAEAGAATADGLERPSPQSAASKWASAARKGALLGSFLQELHRRASESTADPKGKAVAAPVGGVTVPHPVASPDQPASS